MVLSLGNRVSLSGLGTMVCKMSLGLTTGCGCVVVTLRGGIAGTCEAVGLSTYSFCGRGPVRIWSNVIAVLVDGVVSGRALVVSAVCTGAGGGGRAYLDAAECPILPCSPPSIECLKKKINKSYNRNITDVISHTTIQTIEKVAISNSFAGLLSMLRAHISIFWVWEIRLGWLGFIKKGVEMWAQIWNILKLNAYKACNNKYAFQ